jgi:nicotinate-nucleotide adenylyltransferase
MRVGLLGGTFDPIHRGHLDVALAARDALQLTEVRLLPSAQPPHRLPPLASPEHRLAMAVEAARGVEGLTVSDIELRAEGPSYTTATLDRLESAGLDLATAYFITGADAFREIATWKGYPAILDRCHFVVVSRLGMPASAIRAAVPALALRMVDAGEAAADAASRRVIYLVDALTAPVSSTEIRRRVATGGSIAGLVPPGVASYIDRHGLYRGR